jgi:hypothetical protein
MHFNVIKIRRYRKLTIITIGILLFWFTLDITGFVIGEFTLIVSAFKDEPIDILWWIIFIVTFVVFILKDKIGKYVMLVFLIIWTFIQGAIYFRDKEGIQSYYNYFYKEGTHRLIPASDLFLIKDTYHIFLDLFIAVSLVFVIIYIIKDINIRNSKNNKVIIE